MESDCLNTQDSWMFFQERLQESVDRHIPLKRTSRKKQKWMDRNCFVAVKKKQRVWNKYLHTQSHRDYFDYCKVRKICTKVARTAKRRYEKNIVTSMKDNSK